MQDILAGDEHVLRLELELWRPEHSQAHGVNGDVQLKLIDRLHI